MTDILQFTLDKFTFTIPTDRRYSPDGLWVQEHDGRLLVGVSDYFQQHNGDAAFVELSPPGTTVSRGGRFGAVETIKVDQELAAPLSGVIAEVNERLEQEAELINQDPYGAGWLVTLEPDNWLVEKDDLLPPEIYLDLACEQAQREL